MPRRGSPFLSAWRTVAVPFDRFHWLLGARVALAFGGPLAVAHVLGRGQSHAAVIAFAGLLVALVVGGLPAGRVRRVHGPAVVAVIPLVSLLYLVVPAHHPIGATVMALGCLAAGLAPLRWPTAGAIGGAFAMSLLMVPRLPRESHTAVLLLAGGALALGLVVVSDVLCHPGLRLPALPVVRRAEPSPAEVRRHAFRLGVVIAVGATIALLVGDASTFSARSSWMLLGAFVAVQPHQSSTRVLALQRGVGTVLGALLTVLVASIVPGSIWIGWLLAGLAFVAFGLRTVNHAWYCIVLTPIVVLGFTGGPLELPVLAARVTWTTVGVLLAVIATTVLWSRTGVATASANRTVDPVTPEPTAIF